MEHFQEPATCPYPEPDQSSPCPNPTSLISIFISPSLLGLGLPSGLFPSGLPIWNLYASLLSPIRATCPTYHILQIIMLLVKYSSPLPYYLSPLGPNIFLSTLFASTLNLCSPFNVSDQVSRPYTTTGRIIVLYILNYNSFGYQTETKDFVTISGV